MRTWIKLHIEILEDPKMGRLPDRLFRRAIELFLMAGKNDNNGGVLPPVEDIAWLLRVGESDLLDDLQKLQEVNIVHETEPGVWVVTHFAERQDADTTAERVAKHRNSVAKHHKTSNDNETKRYGSCNDDVTKRYNASNEIETKRYVEVEEDKEKEVEKEVDAEAEAESGGGQNPDESYFSPTMQPLIQAFSAATGIHAPVGGGGQTRRWHDAMLELMRMRASPDEIAATCREMLAQGLKIAGPWSIINGLNVYRSRQRAPAGSKNGKKQDVKDVIREYIDENPKV